MHIFAASDHAGFALRQVLVDHLRAAGHTVDDLGPAQPERCDYPDYAAQVARRVAAEQGLGLLVCGTGVGMSMAANKVGGVRAAVVSDVFSASATRAHNDANVICVGQRVVGAGLAIAIVDAFVGTEYEGGRHAARVAKIHALETPAD